MERTLSIIKPDAVERNHIGNILHRFEKAGLKIENIKMLQLSKEEWGKFYEIHRDRPFFDELTTFMSSGPSVISVLKGENAVAKNRKIMGATNPAEADEGTIRKDFATSIDANAVHGSDSTANAIKEIEFFFSKKEVIVL
ncbi:MAG: nucleoside-diphosphate kinase [Chlamydiia bacterium]|nr:nucleoside-diphosphate kinase [Chlamydiia bacterium]